MFRKKPKLKKPRFFNTIFRNDISSKVHALTPKEVIDAVGQQFPMDSPRLKVRTEQLNSLNKILIQLLLNREISEPIISQLSTLEHSCLQLFLFRKKMLPSKHSPLTPAAFRQIQAHPKPKRIEENLKFIFKKLIRFLQEVFRKLVFPKIVGDLGEQYARLDEHIRFEYAFYGYYFGSVAAQVNHRIEKFFHPRNKRNSLASGNRFISKTISKLYVKYISMSRLFVRDLTLYMRHGLLLEIRHSIINKINRMCLNWENKLVHSGPEWLLNWIENNFENNSKCKQAWSVQEVSLASSQILGLVDKA